MKMTVRFFSVCRTNYENYKALGVFWGYTNRISFSSFPKILILDPNWRVLVLLTEWLTSAINQQHINYSLIHKQILPECNCSVAIIKFVHTINKEWAHSYWKILPVLVTITGRLLLFFPSHSHSDCILASNTHSICTRNELNQITRFAFEFGAMIKLNRILWLQLFIFTTNQCTMCMCPPL